ncbi:uncharacterized protein METZ01_LOCUS464966, partial [marine metagenome]
MSSFALLVTLTVVQGHALQLDQLHEAGLISVEASWDERTIPYVHVDDGWSTVIGVDLDTAAGSYPFDILLRYEDGRVATRTDVLFVK